MKTIQNQVNDILTEISKQGWKVDLRLDDIDNRCGNQIPLPQKHPFCFNHHSKEIYLYDLNWTLSDLKELPGNLEIIINAEKSRNIIRKYQEIFDIENR